MKSNIQKKLSNRDTNNTEPMKKKNIHILVPHTKGLSKRFKIIHRKCG